MRPDLLILGIYGLAFFTMGLAVSVRALAFEPSPIRRRFLWLGSFGITHAIFEWTALGKAAGLDPNPVVGNLVLGLSFLALMAFVLDTSRFHRGPAMVAVAILAASWVVVLAAASDPAAADTAARYMLGIPAASGAALTLWYDREFEPEKVTAAIGARIAGAALAAYALLQLFAEPEDFFPATLLNAHSFEATFGFPVAIARTVIALVMTGGILKLLDKFDEVMRRSVRRKLEVAEEALAAREARLREAQQIAKIGSWELDLVRDELDWSDEVFRIFEIDKRKFGASYEAFLGLIHPDDREAVNKAYTESLKTRKPYRLRHRLLMKDGRIKWVEEQCASYFDASGKPVRSAGTVQDISDRVLAEDQIRQLQKIEAVGKLTGGVAHDFNNLLAVVGGNLELLKERLEPNPALQDLAEKALRAVERGAVLTRSLLAFSRQQPLCPEPIDLKRLVQDMADLVRRTAPENIEIETVAEGNLWKCEADPGQLQNALLNLVANARDAMPEGGRLTIETGNARLNEEYASLHEDVTPGQYVMLAVSDTGQGMAAGVIRRAFDPFFTTKGPGKGSGLGLSMVYGFAKQSRGHVKIYSEVGHGTTVKLYLPRTTKAAEEPETPKPIDDLRAAGETVLVVEDDPDVRALTRTLLQSLGYNVLEAGEARQALRMIQANENIALLLVDVILPGGKNGPELSKEVLGLRPEIKTLYMSGYTENAILHHGRLDPGVYLVQKPFTKHELAAKIRRLLGKRV